MRIKLAPLFLALSRYQTLPGDCVQNQGEQKEYLSNLLRVLSVFAACAAAAVAIPSVDIHQFSAFAACFALSLGLSILGLTLDVYLIATTSPRGDLLQLKTNYSIPIVVPAVIAGCSSVALLVGLITMVLDVPNAAKSAETNLNWARYLVVAYLGTAALLSTAIIVSSELVARTSIIDVSVRLEPLVHASLSPAQPPPRAVPVPPRHQVLAHNAMVPRGHPHAHTPLPATEVANSPSAPAPKPLAAIRVPSRPLSHR